MDYKEKYDKLVIDISKSIQESRLSVGLAINAMSTVEDKLINSQAFGGCIIDDEGITKKAWELEGFPPKNRGEINE